MSFDKEVTRGVITKGIGGFYYVDTGKETVECRARGKFRKDAETPMVGDKVEITLNSDGSGSVARILPRKNTLVRPEVANIDMMVLVAAVKSPAPDYALLDKLLAIAESKGIESIICLNKTDLSDDKQAEEFAKTYKKAGYTVIEASAATGKGADEVRRAIKGKTACFTGLSGVGKSSLIKRITGIDLKCGSVSKIQRGKHTTRHTELMPYENGFVFDTPGFSRLDADCLFAKDLHLYFPEIRAYEGQCRFRTCNHRGESGCAVKKAQEDGLIAESRLNNYVELFNRLNEIKNWQRKD